MVRVERRGAATWLVLDRPEALNAFTAASYEALNVGLDVAAADDDTRVVVVTGSGRAFSAGADRSLIDGRADDAERARAGAGFTAMLEKLGASEKPVLAAVNGLAVGVGCTMLLHCDLVVLAASARLRLPFTALGIVPEAGSSVLLPAQVRWPDAMWHLLSSEWIDAEDGRAMGLAWRVVPDDELVARIDEVVATLAALDPAAVAATKRLLVEGRADAVRAAMAREAAAMGTLRRPWSPPGP